MKNIQLWLLSIVLGLAPMVHAQSVQTDAVLAVKLNGINVMQILEFQEVAPVMKGEGIIEKVEFSECTVNYDMYIAYPGKQVRLEFFQEYNEGMDLDGIFSTKKSIDHAYMKATNALTVKARIWITWADMQNFTDVFEMQGMGAIPPDLTVEAFAQMFPVSAKNPEIDPDDAKEGLQRFNVVIGELEEDSPPYVSHVQFIFKAGVLYQLELNRGVAC